MPLTQRLYWRLRPALTPGLENSHITYARELQRILPAIGAWLDVGCGHAFVPEWASLDVRSTSACRRIVGVDRDARALRAHRGLTCGLVADGEALPFADGVFDLVTANMVLEHVAHPAQLFREVFRVLTPGGTFLSHTPNAAGYTTTLTRLGPPTLRVKLAGLLQSRDADDVYPTFYRANTMRGLRRLAREAGFAQTQIAYVESSPLFASLPPLLLPEMLFIVAMRWARIDRLRPCLLTTLRKSVRSGQAVDTAAEPYLHARSM